MAFTNGRALKVEVNGKQTQSNQQTSSFSKLQSTPSIPSTLSYVSTGMPIEAIMNLINSKVEFKVELRTSDGEE